MKSKPLNVRLPDGTKEKLEDYAYALDCGVTDLVTEGVQMVLAKLRQEHGDVGARPSRLRGEAPPLGASAAQGEAPAAKRTGRRR
ncbi:MAG: hypothetical protein ACYC3I_02720 [Gemmataceae bacterium]